MKIYQLAALQQNSDRSFDLDKARGFVVIADSEQQARRLASEQHGDESADFWLRPSFARCDVIGTAARGQNAAVVMRDFAVG
jgi:hypothetical protein